MSKVQTFRNSMMPDLHYYLFNVNTIYVTISEKTDHLAPIQFVQ